MICRLAALAAVLVVLSFADVAQATTPKEALDQEVNVEFVQTPLSDAAEFFSDLTGVKLVLDNRVKERSTPVTLRATGQKYSSVLSRIMQAVDLRYVVEKEFIRIVPK